MKHTHLYIAVLTAIMIPLYGGQPTRSTHKRKESVIITELNKKYNVEIKQISTNETSPMTFGLNFGWPLIPSHNASVFSDVQQEIASEVAKHSSEKAGNSLAIQQEIAREVARRSPEEQEYYLKSIASLTNVHKEWLDFVPQSIALELVGEIEEDVLMPDYNSDTQDSHEQESSASWQPGEIESYIWENRYQLFSEDLVELSLED